MPVLTQRSGEARSDRPPSHDVEARARTSSRPAWSYRSVQSAQNVMRADLNFFRRPDSVREIGAVGGGLNCQQQYLYMYGEGVGGGVDLPLKTSVDGGFLQMSVLGWASRVNVFAMVVV